MPAQIELYGFMKKKQPEPEWFVETGADCDKSVGAILLELGIDHTQYGYTILIEGTRRTRNYVPQEGDSIKIIPLTAGG